MDGNEGDRGDRVRGKVARDKPEASFVGEVPRDVGLTPPEDVRANGFRIAVRSEGLRLRPALGVRVCPTVGFVVAGGRCNTMLVYLLPHKS